MRLIRHFAVSLFALSLATASAQEGKLRIATVDMQGLFKQYYRTIEAQNQINVERARIGKEINERRTKLQTMMESLDKLTKQLQDPSINDQKKQTIKKERDMQYQEAVAAERDHREFERRKQATLTEKMAQRTKGIIEEIRKILEEQAKSDNYDYVFDKSGFSTAQVPVILYSKDATDITATLLKILNKDAPAESKTAPTEAEPAPADSEKKDN